MGRFRVVKNSIDIFLRRTPAIGAIMKMEEQYILEWVAWHKLQGFDLLVADNCVEGPQTRLLQALDRAGWLIRIDFGSTKARPQMPAYRRIYWEALKRGYRYLGFLDADEFFETVDGPIWGGANVVSAQLERRGIHAARFRWAMFGSNGLLANENELVVTRFETRGRPDRPACRTWKSFFRIYATLGKAIVLPHRFLDNPHNPKVSRRRTALDGETALESSSNWHIGRVRHYAVKSREELLRKYHQRGSAVFALREIPELQNYIEEHDLNDEHDPLPVHAILALRQKIEEITGTIVESTVPG